MGTSYDLNLHRLIGRGGSTPAPSGWIRPSEWPALTVPSSNQINGLYAIDKEVTDNDGVNVAFTCTCSSSGTYSVDWGDGTSTTGIASNTKAQHTYLPSNTTGVTDTSYGYKIAEIKITTSTTITAFDTTTNHSSDYAIGYTGYAWLSLDINCSSLTGNQSGPGNSSANNALRALQEFTLRASAFSGTNVEYYFANCNNLQCVRMFKTGSITSLSFFFQNCRSLVQIPEAVDFSSANVTVWTSCFQGCLALSTIPLIDTSAGTNMTSMFNSCGSLKTIPLLYTASCTNMSTMFASCSALESMPLINMQSVTVSTSMFNGCASLKYVPQFDTQALITMTSMFAGCWSLSNIPNLDTNDVTTINTAFNDCYSIKRLRITRFPVATMNLSTCYNLGREALVEIFNALATGSATITITNTRGASALSAPERAIATGKGWTIVG